MEKDVNRLRAQKRKHHLVLVCRIGKSQCDIGNGAGEPGQRLVLGDSVAKPNATMEIVFANPDFGWSFRERSRNAMDKDPFFSPQLVVLCFFLQEDSAKMIGC